MEENCAGRCSCRAGPAVFFQPDQPHHASDRAFLLAVVLAPTVRKKREKLSSRLELGFFPCHSTSPRHASRLRTRARTNSRSIADSVDRAGSASFSACEGRRAHAPPAAHRRAQVREARGARPAGRMNS